MRRLGYDAECEVAACFVEYRWIRKRTHGQEQTEEPFTRQSREIVPAGEVRTAAAVQEFGHLPRRRNQNHSGYGETDAKVFVDRLNLRGENITNSMPLAPSLMARLTAGAHTFIGDLSITGSRISYSEDADVQRRLSCSGIDLSVLRGLIQKP
jgi:hypothetical protein